MLPVAHVVHMKTEARLSATVEGGPTSKRRVSFKNGTHTQVERRAEYSLSDEPPHVMSRVEPEGDPSSDPVSQTVCRVVTRRGEFNVAVAAA